MAEIQGHRDPFKPELLAKTIPQIDFILECYARDNPKTHTFTRPGVSQPVAAPNADASWFNILRGKAREQFMMGRINHAAVRARKAKEAREAKTFGIRGKGVI